MKRVTIFLLMLALLSVPVFAFDFGLNISNNSSIAVELEDSNTVFSQFNRLSLWLSFPVGSDASIYLSGFYNFSGSFSKDYSQIEPYSIDIGRFEWEGIAGAVFGDQSRLQWAVGRTQFNDYSGRVLSTLLDGAKITMGFGNIALGLGAGYTGLLNKKAALLLIDQGDFDIYEDESLYFAPGRLIAQASVLLSEVVNMDMGLQFISQLDIGNPDGTPTDKTNSLYFEPFIEGRLGRSFRWRTWYTVGVIQDPDSAVSMAGGLRLRYSDPELSALKVSLEGLWAGANAEEGKMFIPISVSVVGKASKTLFRDLSALVMDVSLSPTSWLGLGLNYAILMSGDFAEKENFYKGSDISANFKLNIARDLSFDILGGIYIPDEGSNRLLFALSTSLAL